MTSAIPVRCSTNWAMKPHIGSEANLLSSYLPWGVKWCEVYMKYFIYIWIISYILHIICIFVFFWGGRGGGGGGVSISQPNGFYAEKRLCTCPDRLLILRGINLIEVAHSSKWTKKLFKVAENSFQYFSRLGVWSVIITTLYLLTPTSWYQKTAQSLVNTFGIIFVTQ